MGRSGSKIPVTKIPASRILVTGARLPTALEVLRALRDAGAKVIFTGDSISFTPAGASRASAGHLRFSAPALNLAGFRAAVAAFVRERGIELVVPASEEVFYLAGMERELAPARLFAPPLPLLRRLHSKVEAFALAEGCGIRIPRTLRITSRAELEEASRKIPLGILKPEFSRGAYELTMVGAGAAEVLVSPSRPWLVQERLEGRELSIFGVFYEGRVLAAAVYEPLYRAGAGASLYFRPVESEPALTFHSAFGAKHSVNGQLSFDLMENVDGSLSLIECNPRPTSGAHLMPAGWGAAYFGGTVPGSPRLPRARAAKLAVLLLHFWPAVRTGRFFRFARDWLRARDSCFRWRDPLPALVLQLSALEILWRSRAWPVPARQAYTWDLEWNGEGA